MVPSAVELEKCTCPFGCMVGDELVVTGFDRIHHLPGTFQIVRCKGCGLMRTNPRPTPATMGYYYPDTYGPYLSTRIKEQVAAHGWRQRLRQLFEFYTEAVPQLPPGRMLEIGCASGQFLDSMARKGWEVAGIEFSAKAAQAAQAHGYHVHVGPVETAPEPDQLYDLVVGWMVVEHLHDPLGSLQNMFRWTRPGGWIAISVPNAAAAEFRWFQNAWYALHLPAHLFHYTPTTLGRLLTAAGWQVKRTLYQRNLTNVVNSVAYKLLDRRRVGAARALLQFGQYDYSSYLLYPFAVVMSAIAQTGGMTVWAQRPLE